MDHIHNETRPAGQHAGSREAQPNPISGVLEDAARQLPYVEHQRGDNEFIRMPKPAASSGVIDLSAFIADADPVGSGIHAITQRPAGETLDLRQMIEQHSRVIAAGARPIWAMARLRAIAIGGGEKADGLLGFYEDPQLMRVTDPAKFATLADGANAPVGTLPSHDATFTWPAVPNASFRVQVSRSQNRGLGGGEFLRSSLLEAIVLGVAEYIDGLLLAAIAASAPAAFSFGAAAAQHLKFSDLRGLIGTTTPAGASIRQDGTLALAGVDAEFTAASAASFIGAFGTAGVALWPEVSIHANRMSTDGHMDFTCHVGAQAVLPAPGKFFAVA